MATAPATFRYEAFPPHRSLSSHSSSPFRYGSCIRREKSLFCLFPHENGWKTIAGGAPGQKLDARTCCARDQDQGRPAARSRRRTTIPTSPARPTPAGLSAPMPARSGLDEYRILRQLDNKLPDDDSANIVTDNSGVAYLPETAMPSRRRSSRNFAGLYVVMGLGAVVSSSPSSASFFFKAYRVGELSRYGSGSGPGNGGSPARPPARTQRRARRILTATRLSAPCRSTPSTPPPIVEAPTVTNVPVADATTNTPADMAASTNGPRRQSPRAMPVDLSQILTVVANADTNAAPVQRPVTDAHPRQC